MKKYIALSLVLASFLSGYATTQENKKFCKNDKYDVAAIVWPAYHPAPRWKELGLFEHGNGEWQYVYSAVSKFKDDNQPIVPLWGYEPEDNPIVIARRIDAALASGINVFMYDWYWYCGRPFLENALNNGFLKAPNNERMKFFLMYANHNVNRLWDKTAGLKEKGKLIWKADITFDEFKENIVPRWIGYFKKSNYYKLDGKPVLAVFDMNNFISGMGSPEKAKEALLYFRNAVKNAGFNGLHLMSITWNGVPFGRIPNNNRPAPADVVKYYGFDSVSMYNWTGATKGNRTYIDLCEKTIATYDNLLKDYGQFYPVVSTGWDTNPRFPDNEKRPILHNKNPLDYEKALRKSKAWVDKNIPAGKQKLILINAWNEWTEGGYLEPDKVFGYGYLNATARVFGSHGQAKQ